MFLLRARFRSSLDDDDENVASIDPKCLVKLKDAQRDPAVCAALTEAYTAFSVAVRKQCCWYLGCHCHSCIFESKGSIAQHRHRLERHTGF